MAYDPEFLGFTLPLPTAGPSRAGSILRRQELADGVRAEYPTYAVVTDAEKRAPLFAALMIDGAKRQKTSRSDNWRIDSRVGAENQLDNSYYQRNPWDRGHMARRDSAGWGDTRQAAQRASDETFYYSNACLQHENVNQDEWLQLEDWAADLAAADRRRVVVFTGPVFGDAPRIINPPGRHPAQIPAAFFKVVCWSGEDGQLAVAAFMVHQDAEALKDKQGRLRYDFQKYQVTIREIEIATGLEFSDEVYERNPLFFYESEAAYAAGARIFPERFDVDVPRDLIRNSGDRYAVLDDVVDVYIAAANVKPANGQREWVTLLNLGATDVDVNGWTLRDRQGRSATLEGKISAGGSLTLSAGSSLGTIQLGDKGGLLVLRDAAGAHIDRVDYTEREVQGLRAPSKPINFFTYRK